MPPIDFEKLAKGAFDAVKCSLSISATYFPKAGGQYPIRGPFDDRAQQVDPAVDKVISSNLFTFGLKLDDIPDLPKKGDKIVIKEVSYKVVESQEDGVPGVSTVLFLHKVEKSK